MIFIKAHRKQFLLAGPLAVAVTALTLTACGGGAAAGPPNATSVIQSDGYTPLGGSAAEGSAMLASMGEAPADVSSLAIGTNGSDEQVVFVFFSSAKASAFTQGQTGTSGGITVAQNGDVVTATGSEAAFDSAGS
jgi:hypothetical protein